MLTLTFVIVGTVLVPNVMAETKTFIVNGMVINTNLEPLMGATIQVKGSQICVVSITDGMFSLSGVKDGDVLVISYLGMKTQEIKVSGNGGLVSAGIITLEIDEDENLN